MKSIRLLTQLVVGIVTTESIIFKNMPTLEKAKIELNGSLGVSGQWIRILAS